MLFIKSLHGRTEETENKRLNIGLWTVYNLVNKWKTKGPKLLAKVP